MTLKEFQMLKRAWEAVKDAPPELRNTGSTLREAGRSGGDWIKGSHSSIYAQRLLPAMKTNKARARFVIVCFVLMPKILRVVALHVAQQALVEQMLMREVEK